MHHQSTVCRCLDIDILRGLLDARWVATVVSVCFDGFPDFCLITARPDLAKSAGCLWQLEELAIAAMVESSVLSIFCLLPAEHRAGQRSATTVRKRSTVCNKQAFTARGGARRKLEAALSHAVSTLRCRGLR